MIELVRIVEHQSNLSSYRATQNENLANQLELLIEATKYPMWHPFIAKPFNYAPPSSDYGARFRPAYGRNVFYGCLLEETALYEHAFHFIKERLHLKIKSQTGLRTIFSVDTDDSDAVKIINFPRFHEIINKSDYSASHQFVHENPAVTFIIYPSCRDPKHRDNAAILDIKHLAKNIKWESTLNFFYDNQKQQIIWLDYNLHIQWAEVA